MPLRAFFGEQELISTDLPQEQWDALKEAVKSGKKPLILPCCQQPGFLRVSSKGLRHFVHAKSSETCDWKPESAEHLRAKSEIIAACRASGWHAIPEYAENDWRADVLATKNNLRIAFEVQWSPQTLEETEFRQKRYEQANVRGCWFFRKLPKGMKEFWGSQIIRQDIPSFEIHNDKFNNINVTFENNTINLNDFTKKLLNRNLKIVKNYRLYPIQEVLIVFFPYVCYKCYKLQDLYVVDNQAKTVCGKTIRVAGSMWGDDDLSKHPKVYEAVQQFVRTPEGSHLRIGQVKSRYSKTLNRSYLSHGCAYCDVIFGGLPTAMKQSEALFEKSNFSIKVEVDLGKIMQEGVHWCYAENRDFCE